MSTPDGAAPAPPRTRRRRPPPPARGIEHGARALVVGAPGRERRALARDLLRIGLDVSVADGVDEAVGHLRRTEPPLVLCRADDDSIDALALLARLKAEFPRVQRLLVVPAASVERLVEDPEHAPPAHVVVRPAPAGALALALRNALEHHALVVEHLRLKDVHARAELSLREIDQDLRGAVRRRNTLLAVAKRRWERAFDAITDPIVILDERGLVKAANRAYAALAERPITSVVGGACHEVLFGRTAPCAGCPVADGTTATQDGAARFEVPGRRAGQVHEVSLYAVRADPERDGPELEAERDVVCTYRDVSEARETMKHASQVERMAAVGQLAAGVAHELNNPLGGILALTQVLLRDANASPEDHEVLVEIEEAALRCKRIIEALLLFARGPSGASDEMVSIEKVVGDALAVVRSAIRGAGAREELSVEAALPPVKGSSAMLVQALVALVKNSAEALASLPEREADLVVTVRARRDRAHVVLEVSDNGPGVAPEARGLLFTPLFTGRNTAQGAGFGLALVYRIAERHGGSVEAVSGPEGGATFRIVLPAADDGRAEGSAP